MPADVEISAIPHAALMPPATPARLRAADEQLAAEGFPGIPADYQEVLAQSNGLQCQAFVLFGTEQQTMAGGQKFETIHEATAKYADFHETTGKLVLGRLRGEVLLMYDAAAGEYQLVDTSCDDVLHRYADVGEFIRTWLDRSGGRRKR